MKSTAIISAGIVSMLMLVPILVSAEEAAAGATTGAESGGTSASSGASASATITPPPAPPATSDGYSFGESNPQMPPGKGGAGMVAPPKPLLIRESPTKSGVVSPRDAASGLPTGKRMMASGTSPLPPILENRMEKRDEMHDRMMGSGTPMNGERKERMEERKQEHRGEILKRISTQMIARMEAAIERFTTMALRLDSRVAKLKEKGVNTATAEANIGVARTKVAEATTAVGLAKSSVQSAVTAASSTPSSDAGKSVREALQKAREAVVAAHKALVVAIASLKANVKIEAGATTTAVAP